jgi:hypothetical protein
MAEDEEIRQPQQVSKTVANYLDMTTPRSRASKQRRGRREEPRPTTRPPLDNRALSLEEGNDFA